jgi:hypothetical protein
MSTIEALLKMSLQPSLLNSKRTRALGCPPKVTERAEQSNRKVAKALPEKLEEMLCIASFPSHQLLPCQKRVPRPKLKSKKEHPASHPGSHKVTPQDPPPKVKLPLHPTSQPVLHIAADEAICPGKSSNSKTRTKSKRSRAPLAPSPCAPKNRLTSEPTQIKVQQSIAQNTNPTGATQQNDAPKDSPASAPKNKLTSEADQNAVKKSIAQKANAMISPEAAQQIDVPKDSPCASKNKLASEPTQNAVKRQSIAQNTNASSPEAAQQIDDVPKDANKSATDGESDTIWDEEQSSTEKMAPPINPFRNENVIPFKNRERMIIRDYAMTTQILSSNVNRRTTKNPKQQAEANAALSLSPLNKSKTREHLGLVREQKCGLCCRSFLPVNLLGVVSLKAIHDIHNVWESTRGLINDANLPCKRKGQMKAPGCYEPTQICVFCCQMFYDQQHVYRPTRAPSAKHTKQKQRKPSKNM